MDIQPEVWEKQENCKKQLANDLKVQIEEKNRQKQLEREKEERELAEADRKWR